MGRNFPNQKLILPTELATTLSCRKMQPSFTQSNYCGQVRTLHHEFRLHLHSPHHISWLNDTETKECQKEESPLSFSSPSGRWEQQIPPGGEGTEGFTLLLSLFPTCPFLFPNPTQFWEREEKAVPILQLYIIQHVCFMSRLTLPWVRWAILILFPHTAFKFGCLWFKREESNEGKSIIKKDSMK